ncbi:MAG: hypothetical protein AAGA58_07270 [Verrucomicrobiota bacterium]
MKIAKLTTSYVTLRTNIKVNNPLPAPIPLPNYSHRFESGSRELYSIESSNLNLTVPAEGNIIFPTDVKFNFNHLLDTILTNYSQGSEIPYYTNFQLSWTTPEGTTIPFPTLETEGDFPIPRLPEVSLRGLPDIDFDPGSPDTLLTDYRPASLEFDLFLSVKNPNEFPVRLRKFEVALEAVKPFTSNTWIELGEIKTTANRRFSVGQTRDVDLNFSGSPPSLPDSLLLIIQLFTDISKFRIDGSLDLEIRDHSVSFSFPN